MKIENWGYYSLGLTGYEIRINEDLESVTWHYVGISISPDHKAKIYYTKGGMPYVKIHGRRIHLSEVIRSYF